MPGVKRKTSGSRVSEHITYQRIVRCRDTINLDACYRHSSRQGVNDVGNLGWFSADVRHCERISDVSTWANWAWRCRLVDTQVGTGIYCDTPFLKTVIVSEYGINYAYNVTSGSSVRIQVIIARIGIPAMFRVQDDVCISVIK